MLTSPTAKSLADKQYVQVEVLDFSKEPTLVSETVEYYCSLKPERRAWGQDIRERIVIRAEHRWARVPIGNDIYMLSETGEGSRIPLTKENVAVVAFFAEIRASSPGASDGYIEDTPFCQIQFDDESCRRLQMQGLVRLEEFIRRSVPDFEDTYLAWKQTLLDAKAKYEALKRARAPQRAKLGQH